MKAWSMFARLVIFAKFEYTIVFNIHVCMFKEVFKNANINEKFSFKVNVQHFH